MKHLIQTSCFLFLSTISQTSEASVDFKYAYENERLWPTSVVPNQVIYDEEGSKLLDANIPVTLIRAYPDGNLAIVDRNGTFIIQQIKTDFLAQFGNDENIPNRSGNMIFINQIGRRCFDYSHDTQKAVPESKLVAYNEFLTIQTSSKPEALSKTLGLLKQIDAQLEEQKTQPILVFTELMPNKQFYELVTDLEIPYPIVVPIFQKGFINAIYTEREANKGTLLISIHGKLLASYETLEQFVSSLQE